MAVDVSPAVRERLDRVLAEPVTADLDWLLYNSFPQCEVAPDTLADALPAYRRALREDVRFDYELLFVRTLEHSGILPAGVQAEIAADALGRLRRGGFEAADAVVVVRYAVRVLPEEDPFLDRLLHDDALESFRFHWTLDFVLDERAPGEYFALSYLRDEDPATAPVLGRFPVSAARMEQLQEFFGEDTCRTRLAAGWARETHPEERAALEASLRERLPGFPA